MDLEAVICGRRRRSGWARQRWKEGGVRLADVCRTSDEEGTRQEEEKGPKEVLHDSMMRHEGPRTSLDEH